MLGLFVCRCVAMNFKGDLLGCENLWRGTKMNKCGVMDSFVFKRGLSGTIVMYKCGGLLWCEEINVM